MLLGTPVVAVLLLFWSASAHAHEPPTGWWVWVKHQGSIEWIAFAPAYDYDDCVERMLPRIAKLFTSVEPMRGWPPRFKCEEYSDEAKYD